MIYKGPIPWGNTPGGFSNRSHTSGARGVEALRKYALTGRERWSSRLDFGGAYTWQDMADECERWLAARDDFRQETMTFQEAS